MSFFFLLLVNGLLVGMMYSLIAMGFVLIYKASDAINFAQGEFVMFAGFILAAMLQSYGFPLLWSIIITLGLMIILGFVIERVMLRPLIGRPVVAIIMATIGLASILKGLGPLFWGAETKNIPLPIRDAPFRPFNLIISPVHLVGAVVGAVLLAGLGYFFMRSRTGMALRAVADDQQVAMAMGINVERFFGLTWALAGAVSAVGGILWGHLLGVDVQLAMVGLKVFPVVILGGLDSVLGAVLGGLIIGSVESVAAGYIDPYVGGGTKDFIPYIIMIIALMVRPYGFFGREIIERV